MKWKIKTMFETTNQQQYIGDYTTIQQYCNISILSAYYQHIISISSAYHQHIISISSAYYQHIISILSAYHQHIISILSAYYQHIISILSAYYQHIISILSAYIPLLHEYRGLPSDQSNENRDTSSVAGRWLQRGYRMVIGWLGWLG